MIDEGTRVMPEPEATGTQQAASQKDVASPGTTPGSPSPKSIAAWVLVGLVGAIGWGVLALSRGEEISAAWLLAAALGSYAIGYRFYARFIAHRVLKVDKTRATPPNALTTVSTSIPPTGGYFSATTSPPSPAPDRSSDRCSPLRWATCPARSGSSWA